jgi:hypothetical protein
MPGAWLRPCIYKGQTYNSTVFNSHTRANHPGWGLGRRMFLDNPLNIKVQTLVNRTLFSKELCVIDKQHYSIIIAVF